MTIFFMYSLKNAGLVLEFLQTPNLLPRLTSLEVRRDEVGGRGFRHIFLRKMQQGRKKVIVTG